MMSDKSQITSFPIRALEWYSVFDESVSGKPAKWVNDSNENIFSAVVLILSLALAVNTYLTEMAALYLAVSEWKTIADCLIAALVAFVAWSKASSAAKVSFAAAITTSAAVLSASSASSKATVAAATASAAESSQNWIASLQPARGTTLGHRVQKNWCCFHSQFAALSVDS